MFALELLQTFLDVNDFRVNVAHYGARLVNGVLVNSLRELTARERAVGLLLPLVECLVLVVHRGDSALLRLVVSRFRLRSLLCALDRGS